MQCKLLNVAEVADILGVSTQTIYSWVSKGRLPVVKVGRRTLFHPSEIERWISMRSRKEWELQPD
jgi:excisionase family DNA binding protein